MSRAIEIKSIDDLKAILENNPNFTLDNLKEIIPKTWSFEQRITIPILRKLISRYDELDIEDVHEMYLNSDFFDEEYNIQNNEATIEKIISLIQYWKYEKMINIYIREKEKKK